MEYGIRPGLRGYEMLRRRFAVRFKAVEYRAYGIRPYIYAVCNQQATYTVHLIFANLQSGCFPQHPENYIGHRENYIGRRKNYIR